MKEKLDDIFLDKVNRLGKSLITDFSILMKVTAIYSSRNDAVTGAALRTLNGVKALIGDESELTLKMAEKSFFLEDVRVKASAADIENFGALIKVLEDRGLGVLTFKSNLQLDDLINIAYAIRKGKGEAEIQAEVEKLAPGVSVGSPMHAVREQAIDMHDTALISRRAYIRTISALSDTLGALRSGRKPSLRRAKRAMQSLVDCMLKDESFLLGLTTLRGSEDYALNHAANVAVLSLAVGKRLGFNKYQLSRLGIAALFHDIGKADIPSSIINKASELTPGEIALMSMHPVDGVKKLLFAGGLNELSMLSMLVSYEHHICADRSGYPHTEKRSPNIFSRIVNIADDYDSLASGKVLSRKPLGPATALSALFASPTKYDAALLNLFAGIFSA